MVENEGEIREIVTAIRRHVVSFDIPHRRRTETTLVHRFIHGRRVVATVNGHRKVYRYQGLIHRPGVERVGQSVFLLREADADELTRYLSKLRVRYYREVVWVQG